MKAQEIYVVMILENLPHCPVGGGAVGPVGGGVGGGGGFVGGAEVVPPTTGQLEAQKPHLPWPLTWSSLESVSVEHHGSVSSGALPSKVHSLYRTPRNLNGNTHDSPLTVVQPDGGEGVVPGGETVVPDGLLGHSVVPVVDLTQSMTSGKTNHFSKGF